MAASAGGQTHFERPALVLGGGGAYGVVQAAYIYAAYEAGFRPAMVVGTSVGALNGAWIALHPDDPDGLLEVWRGLANLRVVHLNPMRLAARLVRRPISVASNHVVPELIRAHVGEASFEDTRLPLNVVATNLSRGRKEVFRSGPLGRSIMASTAIPGMFEPVEIGGDLYVDGCLTASVDLETAATMGATEILAIALEPPAAPMAHPRTAFGVLRRSLSVLSGATTTAMEACLRRQMPMAVVRPDLSRDSQWRLDDSAEAIRRNVELARAELGRVLDGRGHVARPPVAAPLAGEAALARGAIGPRLRQATERVA